VVNKFRGAAELRETGLRMPRGVTGRQPFGVFPGASGLWLDAEDSLALGNSGQIPSAPRYGDEVLRVSVVRLLRISSVTDIDALPAEPGVLVRLAATPAELPVILAAGAVPPQAAQP
jgi:adenosylcobyric acid synthase